MSYMRSPRRFKPSKKRWYNCIGGPFAGQKLLLTDDGSRATLSFQIGGHRGYYDHFNYHSVKWVQQ